MKKKKKKKDYKGLKESNEKQKVESYDLSMKNGYNQNKKEPIINMLNMISHTIL